MASTKDVPQALTVPWACAISPEHFEGARFKLFLRDCFTRKYLPNIIEAV
jgi:hypothetical protein